MNDLSNTIVVKIGGATLGSHDTTIEDLVALQKQGKSLVVVHGGGKVITDWLAKQGVPTKFVKGERVTDQATLEVAVSVLAGLVNKELVADLNSLGGKAIGISGVDGGLVQGKVSNPDLGFVGAVTGINTGLLQVLLQAGYMPVIAPVSSFSSAKPGEAVKILNVNADTVAGKIAAAIGAERLILLTDVVGVLDQAGKLVQRLTASEAEAMMASGVASGGMIPKIKACLTALGGSSKACIIDGRQPHTLLKEIEGTGTGSIIEK